MNARRTKIQISFGGKDATLDVNKYLGSLTYTDNDKDKADDLQLNLDDKDGIWLNDWLVKNNKDIKGMELEAVIVQKNFDSDGNDKVLNCGVFYIDDMGFTSPPSKVSIKAMSIPYTSTLKTQKKSKAWENIKLSKIANEIGAANGFKVMFESKFDPVYKRLEQLSESDIVFLKKACDNAGIALKVTAKTIVLFSASDYEKKKAPVKIERGITSISKANFGTSFHDAAYSECRVKYTDPNTKQTFEATYKLDGEKKQKLEVNEKVSSNAEAKVLAEKRLKEKNSQEYKASFTLAGDTRLVAGVTVDVLGYGFFDGKYIIESATHTISKGYKTSIKLRKVFEETEKKEEKPKATGKKSIAELAKEVIQGKWGNGTDRKNRLAKAGYNYSAVQAEVNRILL